MANETNVSFKLPVADRAREVWGRKLCWWCLSSGFPLCTFLLGFVDSFCFVFTSSPSYEASPLCSILKNINTPVKHAKSTALGKKCNPSRGPIKHRRRPFLLQRDYRVYRAPQRTKPRSILEHNRNFWHRPPSAISGTFPKIRLNICNQQFTFFLRSIRAQVYNLFKPHHKHLQWLFDENISGHCPWTNRLGITKTCLYNFDPLKPHFYIVKMGFTGVYFAFFMFAQKHRLYILVRTASPMRF